MSLLKMVRPFLPSDLKSLVDLMVRIYESLDTPEERKKAFDYGAGMMKDGKVNVSEWATFGGKLGILTGNGRPKNPSREVYVKGKECAKSR